MRKLRALVTGASGRLGRKLVDELLKRNYAVRCLVRNSAGAQKLSGGTEVAFGDVTDAASLNDACEKVDAVFHCAAIVDYTEPEERMFEVNAKGTVNLLRAASAAKVKRFVHVSSIAVYGEGGRGEIDEAGECRPQSAYGRTKFSGERGVRDSQLAWSIVRPGIIYGRGFGEGFTPMLRMLEKGRVKIIGDGKNRIPFVHVDDVVALLVKCAESKKAGRQIYNCVGPDNVTQEQSFAIAARVLGVPEPKKHVSPTLAYLGAYTYQAWCKLANKKPLMIPAFITAILADRTFSVEKARRQLGWRPKVKFRDGVKEVVAWYREMKNKNQKINAARLA